MPGLGQEHILTDAQLRYFRKAVDGQQTQEIYLKYATINTTAVFPTQEGATEAYLTLKGDPEAWVEQVWNGCVISEIKH